MILQSPEYIQELEDEQNKDKIAIQREYEYAKTQGYKGTFDQYQKYRATQFGTEGGEGDLETSDVIKIYGETLQGALGAGASPEEALSAVIGVAEDQGVNLNLDSRAKLKEYVKKLKPKIVTETVVAPTEEDGGGIFGTVKGFFSRLFGK